MRNISVCLKIIRRYIQPYLDIQESSISSIKLSDKKYDEKYFLQKNSITNISWNFSDKKLSGEK